MRSPDLHPSRDAVCDGRSCRPLLCSHSLLETSSPPLLLSPTPTLSWGPPLLLSSSPPLLHSPSLSPGDLLSSSPPLLSSSPLLLSSTPSLSWRQRDVLPLTSSPTPSLLETLRMLRLTCRNAQPPLKLHTPSIDWLTESLLCDRRIITNKHITRKVFLDNGESFVY